MPDDLDGAKQDLRRFIDYPEDASSIEEPIAMILDAGDEEGLGLLSQVLELDPDASHLARLWEIAESGESTDNARRAAMQAVNIVLVGSRMALDEPDQYDPILSAGDLEAQAQRSMKLFGQEELPGELRLLALESAGISSSSKDVVVAGEAAYAHDDSNWVAAGLFVLRNTQPERARELVYQALDNDDFVVRSEAITGLAELGEEEDLKRLTDFVYDGSVYETSAALWALVEVPKQEASDILAEAARWLDGEVKEEARAANLEWTDRWGYLYEKEEEEWAASDEGPEGKLDKYLSTDDFGEEDWGDDGGD
jgi:hypothetical protein